MGISARIVGGGVSASLGRGALELDFRASASPPPVDFDMELLDQRFSGTLFAGRRVRLPAADVSTFCGAPFDDTGPITGLICCATGAGKQAVGVAPSVAKPRRPCRFAPLGDHVPVAARLGFTGAAVLRATSDFPTGVGKPWVPAGYEPLDESIRLAVERARPLRHCRNGDSQAIAGGLGIGERWYMD